MTTEKGVLDELNELYKGKYDFKEVSFPSVTAKVKSPVVFYICPKHGLVMSRLSALLQGKGCNACFNEGDPFLHELNTKLLTKEFVDRSNLIHNNKYDYSKTVYVKQADKVTITCPIHGDFEQTPMAHLKSGGCIKCGDIEKAKKNQMTTEKFIEKAIAKTGTDAYDYSEVDYKDHTTKVHIKCNKHNEWFDIVPSQFLHKPRGCKQCTVEQVTKTKKDRNYIRITNKELFEQEARKVHSNKYTYNNVPDMIVSAEEKVPVTCPIHGDFLTTVHSHIRKGKICQECSKENKYLNLRKYTPETLEPIFRSIHGNEFTYDWSTFKDTTSKMKMTCDRGHVTWQAPSGHLNGYSCEKCVFEDKKISLDKMIERFRFVHGDRYDYSQVKNDYDGRFKPVEIICPIHGSFWQAPNDHLKGGRCIECAGSKGEQHIGNLLRANNIKYQVEYKLPNTGTLYRYDFYLPDYNLLIEYHGGQHYKPISIGGTGSVVTKLRYEKIKESDVAKVKLAKENGYELLVIKFNATNISTLIMNKLGESLAKQQKNMTNGI